MTRILGLVLALIVSGQANASTRSFFTPMEEGQRVGACLSDGATCGKAVADAFCKRAGFAESILFARENVPSARQLDTGKTCVGNSCQAFTRIKCFQPQAQAQGAN